MKSQASNQTVLDATQTLIGRTIAGKYEIDALVGQGAMGSVYKARQTTLGTTLAVKVLHRQLAGEPMFAARFLREAQAASRVDHPSSMRVIDFGEEPDGLLYIAMEYVDGKTLARIIDENGPLPVTRIVDIACQTLAALAVAHDIGVIHRDLKPENIMILEGQDDEGHLHDIVKVCDFGVAKLLEGGARGPSVTAEGVVVGTPEYMSPEQARGESLDARSDIYAMGVLLFHLMTGKVPFDSSTAFGTAFMHVNDEPTRPRLLNPRVDSRLEKICLKAMRKRREDRYSCARELRVELRALVGHDDAYSDAYDDAFLDPGQAPPPSMRDVPPPMPGSLLAQVESRPRRTGLVMAGVVLVATLAFGNVLYKRSGQAEATPPKEPVQTTTVSGAQLPAAPKAGAPAPIAATPAAAPTIVDAPELVPAPRSAAPRANAPTQVMASARRSKTKGGAAVTDPADIPMMPQPIAAAEAAAAAKPVAKPDAAKPAPAAKPVDPADAPLPDFPIPGIEQPAPAKP